MQSVPVFSEADVANLIDYRSLTDAMRDALIAFSANRTIQPVRQMLPVEPEQRYLGIMPAVTPDAMGAKLVSFFPGNAGTGHETHYASIVLLDPQRGQPLAYMDGRLITEMRTAATSAAVTCVCAAPEARTIGLIGSGVQAAAHLAALGAFYDFDDVRVWSRNPNNAQLFAERHNAVACSAREAVEDADIVVCATSAVEPILKGEWLKSGVHVNSVGSPRPNWRELDDSVMENYLIVDSREAVLKEAGDVILSGASIQCEAGELLSGKCQVELTETTVFKSVGIAVEDLAAARLVYDRYRQRNG